MAVDGRKLGDILSNRDEHSCIPCARDGGKVAAIKYCVECDENLCSTCLTHHNRFPMMIGHQMLEKLSSQTGKKKQDLPKQICDKHGGKLVDLYCSNHDSVGCYECVELDHSSCQGIKYISCVAKGIEIQKEIQDLETKLDEFLTQLDKHKQHQQDRLKNFQQEKARLLAEIRVIRKRINDQLDKMEKLLTDEVESKFDLNIDETNQEVDTIIKMKSSVENRKKVFQDAKSINEAELFVQLKMGNSTLGKNERILNSINTNDTHRSMKLFPSRDVCRLLENDNISLGRFSENLVVKSAKLVDDISICLESDIFTCSVRDACFTAKGHVVITDLDNKRIKKLDDSYAVIEHLDMPSSPFGLCEVDNTLLAVTLIDDKKVQYVSQTPLTLRNAFSVSDCCRGIDSNNGQLYVCCGGDREKGEGPGHIAVYDTTGVLLRSYYEGQKWPLYTKITDDENIFISDYFKTSPLTLSMTSHILSEMHIEKLTEPLGSCRIGDGHLCIAGWNSDNIVMVSESGKCQQELLTSRDGIVKPRSVCFDKTQSRLIVMLDDSDIIKVFTLILN